MSSLFDDEDQDDLEAQPEAAPRAGNGRTNVRLPTNFDPQKFVDALMNRTYGGGSKGGGMLRYSKQERFGRGMQFLQQMQEMQGRTAKTGLDMSKIGKEQSLTRKADAEVADQMLKTQIERRKTLLNAASGIMRIQDPGQRAQALMGAKKELVGSGMISQDEADLVDEQTLPGLAAQVLSEKDYLEHQADLMKNQIEQQKADASSALAGNTILQSQRKNQREDGQENAERKVFMDSSLSPAERARALAAVNPGRYGTRLVPQAGAGGKNGNGSGGMGDMASAYANARNDDDVALITQQRIDAGEIEDGEGPTTMQEAAPLARAARLIQPDYKPTDRVALEKEYGAMQNKITVAQQSNRAINEVAGIYGRVVKAKPDVARMRLAEIKARAIADTNSPEHALALSMAKAAGIDTRMAREALRPDPQIAASEQAAIVASIFPEDNLTMTAQDMMRFRAQNVRDNVRQVQQGLSSMDRLMGRRSTVKKITAKQLLEKAQKAGMSPEAAAAALSQAGYLIEQEAE